MGIEPIRADDIEGQKGKTIYPAPFDQVVAGRTKKKLGDEFGLKNFGVNLTHLEPNSASAIFHWHAVQDEFVYVLDGVATLLVGEDEYELTPGDCVGFRAGTKIGHQIVNRGTARVSYLEIGDRLPGDHGEYPREDLAFEFRPDSTVAFTRKDGTPY